MQSVPSSAPRPSRWPSPWSRRRSRCSKRPGDVSNPDAAFARKEGAGKEKEPKPKKTINWPRYGYDVGRSKFLDAPKVRPPFRKVWKYTGDELIEFPPIVVDNRLYFIDNDGVYMALDARTGKVVWKKQLASLNASSPAYFKGVLYSVSLSPGQALARSRPRRQGALAQAAGRPRRVLAARHGRPHVLRQRGRGASRARHRGRLDRSGRPGSAARSRPRRRSPTASSTSATTAAT